MSNFKYLLFDILYYIFLVLLIYHILSKWSSFHSCSTPLNYWLLGTFSFYILKRFYLFLMSSIQGRICFKLSVFVYILLIFPSFLVWTIMGTLWVINDCDNELCKDEVGYFWILYLFQVVSYLLIVILFCYLGHEISHYYRMRRIRTRIEDILNNIDVLLASNAMTHSLEDPFFGNNDLGLSIKERAYLKEELLVDIESLGVCSICLEEFKKADFAIVLPGCKHVFHSVCVKEWLERKGFCPNCKGDVRKEIEKAVFSE